MLSHMHPQLAEFFQYRLAQQELMKELGESGVALSMQQDLRALRGWYKLFGQRVGGPILDMAEVSDLVADTDERPIRLRRYRPDITAMEAPALIYFHGGGWSMGDLDTHDRVCRRLAHAAQAIVIAVDYALAPELPWPQAPHDSIAATRWILQNADTLGIDARRVGVAGDSAGGNLAAIVALALPQLACQILIYPATDLRSSFHPPVPIAARQRPAPAADHRTDGRAHAPLSGWPGSTCPTPAGLSPAGSLPSRHSSGADHHGRTGPIARRWRGLRAEAGRRRRGRAAPQLRRPYPRLHRDGGRAGLRARDLCADGAVVPGLLPAGHRIRFGPPVSVILSGARG